MEPKVDESFRQKLTVLESSGSSPWSSSGDDPSVDDDDPVIGQTFSGCVVHRKLGQGGMGAVYLARHELLGVDVVVKVMQPHLAAQPKRVERFLLEARAAARIDHPNVVRVQHLGTSERGLPYIVMQYVEGTNLDQRIKTRGAHDPAEATRIVVEVARALGALHAAGIIHRDVKAENVVVTPGGEVKLIDFGLVKDLNSDLNLTRHGALIGTPAYIAPEVGREPTIDGRADIYSLGLTYYYLLTAKAPFVGWAMHDVIFGRARLRRPEAFNPRTTDAHRRVLARMVARRREHRHPDVPALLRDLEALLTERPVEAPEDPADAWAARTPPQGVKKVSSGRLPAMKKAPSARVPAAVEKAPAPAPAPAAPPPEREPVPAPAPAQGQLLADALAPTAPPPSMVATTRVVPVQVSGRRKPPEGVAAALADPTRRLGSYVLLEVLDASGAGVLHRGWDLPRGAPVLVRTVDGVRRLEPAADHTLEAVRRLRHPAIAAVLDHGLSDGRLFVVVEPPDGAVEPLSSRLGLLEPDARLRAVRDVASALAHAHERGVVHGALTPASVLVDEAGRPTIVDLGVAHAEHPDRLRARLERAGSSSSDAVLGREPLADLQALGLLLARALVGTSLPRPDLVAACRRCLEGEYLGAADLARDLDRALREPPVPGRVALPTPAALVGMIALAVIVGILIGSSWL